MKEIDSSLKHKKCPECGGRVIEDEHTGEFYCSQCGIIIEENVIDTRAEWRSFNHYDFVKKARTAREEEHSGVVPRKIFSSRDYRWMKGIVSSPRERRIKVAIFEIKRMASLLRTSREVKQRAIFLLLKTAKRRRIIKNEFPAAILYIACRQYGVPRTLKEIQSVSGVDKKKIFKSVCSFTEEFNIKTSIVSPLAFVDRFCCEIGVSENVKRRTTDILNRAIEQNLHIGRSPDCLAATAIFIALKLEGCPCKITRISNMTKVSSVAIRERTKELIEKLNLHIGLKKPIFYDSLLIINA